MTDVDSAIFKRIASQTPEVENPRHCCFVLPKTMTIEQGLFVQTWNHKPSQFMAQISTGYVQYVSVDTTGINARQEPIGSNLRNQPE